jgi:hypothetical protein
MGFPHTGVITKVSMKLPLHLGIALHTSWDLGTHEGEGRTDTIAVVGVVTKFAPDREPNPNFPDSRQSLYRTSYPDSLN